jgi:hypothetical protein
MPPISQPTFMSCSFSHLCRRAMIGLGFIAAATFAQSPNASSSSAAASNSADSDWAAVSAAGAPAGQSAKGKTPAEHAAAHITSANKARETAKAANSFYTKHPDDPRAQEARKIEAVAALHAADGSNADEDRSAIELATTARHNPTLRPKDRFEIAVALADHDRSKTTHAHGATLADSDQANQIETWRGEFGPIPEVDIYAIHAASTVNPKIAACIASRVAQSAAAPAEIKAEAKRLSQRAELLGSPVGLVITSPDGSQTDLATESGDITILVVWHGKEPDSLRELTRYAKAIRRNVQVIYIAVGGTAAGASAIQGSLPIAGKSTYAPVTSTVEALRLHSMPYLFVVNHSGKLSDFGPLSQAMVVLGRSGAIQRKQP